MTAIQKWAWVYGALALFVVSLGYIPGFTNDQGLLFGLFAIDPVDDVIHFLTGVVAVLAAWHSRRTARFFFITFAVLYGLDVIAGLLLQRGFLDTSVFTQGGGSPSFSVTNIALNLPHILLVGLAIVIVAVWGKTSSASSKA